MEEAIQVKPIRNAIVLLTNQCNCACPYCFEARDPERMSLQTAKDVVSFLQLSQDKSLGFTFFGGEPMLEWENIIVPLVEWAEQTSPIPIRFNMTTNGTLLTSERLDYLLKHKIQFMISMDGDRETQERGRPMRNGESSFDCLMSILPELLEKKPQQVFRVTLTPKLCQNLFHDILFFEKIGCKNLGILPNFFETWTEQMKEILYAELKKYERYVIDSFRRGKSPLLFMDYQKAFYRIILATRFQKSGKRRLYGACSPKNQCGMGIRGSVSIDVHGDIYACHHISPLVRKSIFYLGDIYQGIDESRVHHLIEMYNPQKVGTQECRNCSLDSICNGGCKSNNYQINGDLHIVPDMYCFWERVCADSAYRIADTLGKEENTAFIRIFQEIVRGNL